MTIQTAWPEGVIARYVTVGGQVGDRAVVEVRHFEDEGTTQAKCTACPHYDTTDWGPNWKTDVWHHGRDIAEEAARDWAQAHAEKCRALPKPTA